MKTTICEKPTASPSPRKSSRNGFTLVELLVVIGIIAVLIAILLPTLGKIQARSRTTVCQSNLRQVGIGVRLYLEANRYRFPDNFVTGGWFNYRRLPGLTDPNDFTSYPEWMGWPAVLHGIKINDFNFGQTKQEVTDGLNRMLSRKGMFLSATSKVWLCPAYAKPVSDFGNSYLWNINNDTITKNYQELSRTENSNIALMFDNNAFMPVTPGAFVAKNKESSFSSAYRFPDKN